MKGITSLTAVPVLICFLWATANAASEEFIGPPILGHPVATGDLPPVTERLPTEPSIVNFAGSDKVSGKHGGTLRIVMAKSKDTRQMVVYGYARLVCYDLKYEFVPDILERLEIDEGRIFTLYLRPGHKWSDGHPFTAEDFRYYWEDVANNEELSPFGSPKLLLVDDKPPVFEILDSHTVRYILSSPNRFLLPRIAGASPLFIYRPAHYLKQFHAKYADPDALAALVAEQGQRNWAALHHRKDRQYKNNNPSLPTLQPWMLVTKPPSERFVFKRNPYYHRVDETGRQLPYIDQVIMSVANSKIVPLKTGAGESDLQARYLRFDNYTFLKESEQRNDYSVRLWQTAKGAHFALFPNLNANDPVWRGLLRDVRFRRALSLAIDRHEVNLVVYFGLALEGNNTVLPQSPLFRKADQQRWTEFDLAAANRLLDEIGLTERGSRDIRLMPDGRPLEIVVETAGESTEQTDVLELIHTTWRRIGVKLHSKPSQREVFRNRIFSGETVMSVWSGLENGVPNANQSPFELAPTNQHQLQWPKWGQNYETNGQAGELIDMPAAQDLAKLNEQWFHAKDMAERELIWRQMLEIYTNQMFTIGVVSGTLQPVVVANSLRNIPQEAIYNWDPGAHFGIYKPDTFFFADPQRRITRATN